MPSIAKVDTLKGEHLQGQLNAQHIQRHSVAVWCVANGDEYVLNHRISSSVRLVFCTVTLNDCNI